MADSSEAPSEGMLSFKVKTSGDKTHSVTISESAKVSDLKDKLAGEDFENIPAERQRLIYSGRVMKNDEVLSTYKIKPGNTVHMVKSAASNPAPASSSASATPTPAAVPQNMASGTSAGNLMAGLTGARFAGHANLPSASMFGADGGMGPPPSEEEMANMLEDPAVMATMSQALDNPDFINLMIQSNPFLRNNPNARQLLQSPYFRQMLTNPDSIRQAARMRQMMGGGAGGAPAFPAPGVTDNTPAGAPASGPAAGGNPAQPAPGFPDLAAMFGGGAGQAGAAQPDWAAMFGGLGGQPATGAGTGANPATNPASPPAAGSTPAAGAAPGNAQANPFAALFGGGMPGAQPGAGGQNPFGALGQGDMMRQLTEVIEGRAQPTPELTQQAMQFMGQFAGGPGGGAPGGFGGFPGFGNFGVPPAPAAPPDNRPPEERYAEQLRQLNDMGFFDFDQNVAALRRSGGSVQGAIEHLLG